MTSLLVNINKVPDEYKIGFKIPSWDFNKEERKEEEKKKKEIDNKSFKRDLLELLKINNYKKFNSDYRFFLRRYDRFNIKPLFENITQLDELIKLYEIIKIDIFNKFELPDDIQNIITNFLRNSYSYKEILDSYLKKLKIITEKECIEWVKECIKNPIIPKKKINIEKEYIRYQESARDWYEKKKFCEKYIDKIIFTKYQINNTLKKKMKHYIYIICIRKKKKKETVKYGDIINFMDDYFEKEIFFKVDIKDIPENSMKNSEKFCNNEYLKRNLSLKISNFISKEKKRYYKYIYRQYTEDKKKEEKEIKTKRLIEYFEKEKEIKDMCTKYNIPYKENKKPPGKIWFASNNTKKWTNWEKEDKKRIYIINRLKKIYETEEIVKSDCLKYEVEYLKPSKMVDPYNKFTYKFDKLCEESYNRVSKMNFKINKKKRIEEWNNLDEKKKKRFVEYFNEKYEFKRLIKEKEKAREEMYKKAREKRRNYIIKRTSNSMTNKPLEQVYTNTGHSITREPGESNESWRERKMEFREAVNDF